MSKTTRTIIAALFAAVAGVILWVLLMPPRDGVMGGIMCPTCVVGWVGGVLAMRV